MRKHENLSDVNLIENVQYLEELTDDERFNSSMLLDFGLELLDELKTEAFVRFALSVDSRA